MLNQPQPQTIPKLPVKALIIGTAGVLGVGIIGLVAIANRTTPNSPAPTALESARDVQSQATTDYLNRFIGYYVGSSVPGKSETPGYLGRLSLINIREERQIAETLQSDPNSPAYQQHPIVGAQTRSLQGAAIISHASLGTQFRVVYSNHLTGEEVTVVLPPSGGAMMGAQLIMSAEQGIISEGFTNDTVAEVGSRILQERQALMPYHSSVLGEMNLIDDIAVLRQLAAYDQNAIAPYTQIAPNSSFSVPTSQGTDTEKINDLLGGAPIPEQPTVEPTPFAPIPNPSPSP